MTRTIKLMIIRQGADAGGDEQISIEAPDDLSVAQLKRNHFGSELAAGKRIRIIHMGSELADGTLFQTMQDQSTLHCVIAGGPSPSAQNAGGAGGSNANFDQAFAMPQMSSTFIITAVGTLIVGSGWNWYQQQPSAFNAFTIICLVLMSLFCVWGWLAVMLKPSGYPVGQIPRAQSRDGVGGHGRRLGGDGRPDPQNVVEEVN